jgi:uncharacterized low-complexity protein
MKNIIMALLTLGFMALATGCGDDTTEAKVVEKKAEVMKCGPGKCGAAMMEGSEKNATEKKCGADKKEATPGH